MKDTTGRILSLLAGGLCLLTLAAFALAPESAPMDERAYVSADKVRAAIETATTERDGPIGGIAVETEEDGLTLIEVIIQDSNGTPFTVEINAETNEVVEIERGIEEHHEFEGEEEEEEENNEEEEYGGGD